MSHHYDPDELIQAVITTNVKAALNYRNTVPYVLPEEPIAQTEITIPLAAAVGYNLAGAIVQPTDTTLSYIRLMNGTDPWSETGTDIISWEPIHRYRVTITFQLDSWETYTDVPETLLLGIDTFFSIIGVDHTQAYTAAVYDTVSDQSYIASIVNPYEGLPTETACAILSGVVDIDDIRSLLLTSTNMRDLVYNCVTEITAKEYQIVPYTLLSNFTRLKTVTVLTIRLYSEDDAIQAASSSIQQAVYVVEDENIGWLKEFVDSRLDLAKYGGPGLAGIYLSVTGYGSSTVEEVWPGQHIYFVGYASPSIGPYVKYTNASRFFRKLLQIDTGPVNILPKYHLAEVDPLLLTLLRYSGQMNVWPDVVPEQLVKCVLDYEMDIIYGIPPGVSPVSSRGSSLSDISDLSDYELSEEEVPDIVEIGRLFNEGNIPAVGGGVVPTVVGTGQLPNEVNVPALGEGVAPDVETRKIESIDQLLYYLGRKRADYQSNDELVDDLIENYTHGIVPSRYISLVSDREYRQNIIYLAHSECPDLVNEILGECMF